jgi:hypothetical protein
MEIFIICVIVIIIVVFNFCVIKALLSLSERMDNLEKNIDEAVTITKSSIKPPENIENQISSGLIKGLQQIKDADEKQLKLIEMARKMRNVPAPIMNQNYGGPEILNTGGDLIPDNLTKEEIEVLKVWYEK